MRRWGEFEGRNEGKIGEMEIRRRLTQSRWQFGSINEMKHGTWMGRRVKEEGEEWVNDVKFADQNRHRRLLCQKESLSRILFFSWKIFTIQVLGIGIWMVDNSTISTTTETNSLLWWTFFGEWRRFIHAVLVLYYSSWLPSNIELFSYLHFIWRRVHKKYFSCHRPSLNFVDELEVRIEWRDIWWPKKEFLLQFAAIKLCNHSSIPLV